jgi:hypothetical protein
MAAQAVADGSAHGAPLPDGAALGDASHGRRIAATLGMSRHAGGRRLDVIYGLVTSAPAAPALAATRAAIVQKRASAGFAAGPDA